MSELYWNNAGIMWNFNHRSVSFLNGSTGQADHLHPTDTAGRVDSIVLLFSHF